MEKELWQFIKSAVLFLVGVIGILGSIALFVSGGDAYRFLALFTGAITIWVLRSAVSYVSNRFDERKNLESKQRVLDLEKQKMETQKKEFEAYKKREDEKLTNLAEKVQIHIDLELKKHQLEEEKNKFILEKQKLNGYIKEKEQRLNDWKEKEVQNIQKLTEEKSKGFPWLAKAYADYFYLRELKEADYLEQKSHPAPVSAERVREIARERRIIEEKLRIAQGIINYYQTLFPFLEELLGEPEEEILKYILSQKIEEPIKEVGEIGVDPVRIYLSSLSDEEYQKLSSVERNQLALDRYWTRRKNSWEVGRDYERYIGYLYETKGYNVEYKGILEGFDDLGRDLICKKEEQTIIIQCKHWSLKKKHIIHEKHINQLYGTVIKHIIDNKLAKQPSLFPSSEKVSAILYTTTKFSDRAKEFAKCLGIGIAEEFPLQKYPSIKCNVSRRNGEKIYHLPFDQQYDRTLIEEERNECYVETVKEAESLGYRRAWRWKGEQVE